ncbi:hypothetical protein BGI30_04595 [Snodgrassella alvi]|jgi:hypothetical protein|uniref:hypothetical protein n=1 Tax=Snodgrassella alvi TaxID=1196083 RepID=UPI000C1EC900|nr:hypothetical protein [Snodgrassella alvi]PIT11039.1 hypothetical protein BGI30_04595 [Snodgrassella alvi]PIT55261.1 hypothetical protein BHC59_11405 [Snodgrassella alvi]
MNKQETQLIEIEKKADELMQAINAFAFALRHEHHFFPDITVRLCAEAIHDISNISALVYSLNPELRPSYLQTTDFSNALEEVKQQLTWCFPPCTKKHVEQE